MIHFYKTPLFLRKIAPELSWKINTSEKIIYLTFDDGPIPGLTDFVLDELKKYDAKATFFCVGENILKHGEICQKIVEEGHLLGNHTFNHLKGWRTDDNDYFKNIDQCQRAIEKLQPSRTKPLFRPPYGQITKKQIAAIKANYQIIMWDILTYDYERKIAPPGRLNKIIAKTSPGSIVVFHDNYKGEQNLRQLLPRFLEHFSENGFRFKKLATH